MWFVFLFLLSQSYYDGAKLPNILLKKMNNGESSNRKNGSMMNYHTCIGIVTKLQ